MEFGGSHPQQHRYQLLTDREARLIRLVATSDSIDSIAVHLGTSLDDVAAELEHLLLRLQPRHDDCPGRTRTDTIQSRSRRPHRTGRSG